MRERSERKTDMKPDRRKTKVEIEGKRYAALGGKDKLM